MIQLHLVPSSARPAAQEYDRAVTAHIVGVYEARLHERCGLVRAASSALVEVALLGERRAAARALLAALGPFGGWRPFGLEPTIQWDAE